MDIISGGKKQAFIGIIDTENRLVVARHGDLGVREMGEGGQKV